MTERNETMSARYRCTNIVWPEGTVCGWVGTEDDMGADFTTGDGDDYNEEWSNWICPRCKHWASDLSEYERES